MSSVRCEDEGRQIAAVRDGDVVHLYVADGQQTTVLYLTKPSLLRLSLWMLWSWIVLHLDLRLRLRMRKQKKELLGGKA